MFEGQQEYAEELRAAKRRANVGMGVGFVLQLVGAGLWRWTAEGTTAHLVGLVLLGLGSVAFAFSCWNLAEEKGYPAFFGLIGLLGIPGFLIMLALPDNE